MPARHATMHGLSMPRRAAAVGLALLALTGLTSCIALPPALPPDVGVPITDAEHAEQLAEHWEAVDPGLQDTSASILMSFSGLPEDADDRIWDDMFRIELAAGDALLDAEIGYLDGNGSDGEVYEVFFLGSDPHAMWAIIEPFYVDAPLAWSKVQGWESLEAVEPALDLSQ
jgi:hypothetical protein